MPRFTLHRRAEYPPDPSILEALRKDPRVHVVGALSRMVLFESTEVVALEWKSKREGWKLAAERQARVPDPRPKLKRRASS